MKKYMIAAAALFLFAGVSNAQVAKKQSTKVTAAKPVASSKTAQVSNKAAASTATVTPTATKPTSPNATIKRKHYHKNIKTEIKTGAK